jgi:FtsH-binding integral membrane protein
LKDFTKLFDPYERQARLFPVVLTLVPIFLVIATAYPMVLLSEFPKNVVTVVFVLAIAYVLSGSARMAGKKAEAELFESWGGAPTTAILRHRDATLDDLTKRRYQTALSGMMTGTSWPSVADEAADPVAADATYASAVALLRARRRTDVDRIVLAENTAYGFRRNTYGLKTIALLIALIGAAIAAALVVAQLRGVSLEMSAAKIDHQPKYVLLLLSNIALALWWWHAVRPTWVCQAAYDYARALLSTLDAETPIDGEPAHGHAAIT